MCTSTYTNQCTRRSEDNSAVNSLLPSWLEFRDQTHVTRLRGLYPYSRSHVAGPSYFPEHINVHSRQWVTWAWKHGYIFFTHSSPFAVVTTLKKYRAGTSLPETATSEDQLNRRHWASSRPGSHKLTLSLSSSSQEIREQSSIAFPAHLPLLACECTYVSTPLPPPLGTQVSEVRLSKADWKSLDLHVFFRPSAQTGTAEVFILRDWGAIGFSA